MFENILELIDDFRMWVADILFEISEWVMPKSYKPYDYTHYEDYIQKLSGM
jgi:hypothetical protein